MASLKSQKPPKHTFDLTITSSRRVSDDANTIKSKSRRKNKQSNTDDDVDSGEDDGDHQASGSEYAEEGKMQDKTNKTSTPASRGRPSSADKNDPKKCVLTKIKNYQTDRLWAMIHRRDRDIFGLRKSREEQVRLKSGRVDDIGGYKERLKEAAEKTDHWKSMYDSEKHKNRESKEEIKQLKGEVDSKEVAVVGMQEERLGLLQRSDVPAQDDAEVTRQLTSLLQKCYEWTKAWGFTDWSDAKFSTAVNIRDDLLRGDAESSATARAGLAIIQGQIPPRVLLLALLNRELCQETFIQPLAVLKADVDDPTSDKHCWDTLELLMKREYHGPSAMDQG